MSQTLFFFFFIEDRKGWEGSSLIHPLFLCKAILVLAMTFGGDLVIKEQLLFEDKGLEKKRREERKKTPKDLIKKSYK
jgi:hypothetical protein